MSYLKPPLMRDLKTQKQIQDKQKAHLGRRRTTDKMNLKLQADAERAHL